MLQNSDNLGDPGQRTLRRSRRTNVTSTDSHMTDEEENLNRRTSSRLRSRSGKENVSYNTRNNNKRRKVQTTRKNVVKKPKEPESSDYMESDSSLSEYDFPDIKPVKVLLGARPYYVANPTNIIKPAVYNQNIENFLDSYRTFIDDRDMSVDEYNENINSKRELYNEIKGAISASKLKRDVVTKEIKLTSIRDYTISKNYIEPIKLVYKEQNMFPLQDHLINHAIVMKNLFKQVQKNKTRIVKKIAMMIEVHFKNIKNATEREMKEKLKYEKQMCKKIASMVKKHWLLAGKAYNIINERYSKETEEIERKKNLNEMLEKSSKLLDRQINKNTTSPESSVIVKESEAEESTFPIHSAAEDQGNADDDDELSVEELKLKYQTIEEDFELSDDISAQNIKLTKQELEMIEDEKKHKDNNLLDEFTSDESSKYYSSSEPDTNSEQENKNQGLSALIADIDSDSESENESIDGVKYESELELESEHEHEKDLQTKKIEFKHSKELINEKETVLSTNEKNADNSVEDVSVPSLLKGTLRIYQKQGLNWLANLYNTNTNGILADEMGLGKTIQTISLLCYLAETKQVWGPHLIIVPTSVLLNWEMEFKKFAPGLKILSYYGSPTERVKKRKGWNKQNTFHVVITSYQLAVTDQHVFKRKRWGYMILDEAHNIKNFRSGRWQALLSFNSERRLLLTGTPLQNNLTELWSLLYFLMPRTIMENGELEGFADIESFHEWFGKPFDKLIEQPNETSENDHRMNIVNKLHQVLRPYLLRRLKKDVEKQMPAKYEHIIMCKLSKRQRYLYDEFMSRTQTKETLKSGNYLSIINCLMQLRKVCNHPDLFEVRPIVTSFAFKKNINHDFVVISKKITKALQENISLSVNKEFLNLTMVLNPTDTLLNHEKRQSLSVKAEILTQIDRLKERLDKFAQDDINFQDIESFYTYWEKLNIITTMNKLLHLSYVNDKRLTENAPFSKDLVQTLKICNFRLDQEINIFDIHSKLIESFCFITPKCVVLENNDLFYGNVPRVSFNNSPFHQIETNLSIEFPNKFLLQYDCGKLQKLATLLKDLKNGGHKVLIFTQMTKILDILEIFLNYHHYTYSRLDGATKIEDRQLLTERFNTDPKIFTFILSSRSGGVGINLTGADTVIFYDSDWNPAMDKQCQDRCHRIGQMRDVNIYRLVSEHTIESNILNKAMQKTQLDNMVIQEGNFNTDFLNNLKNEQSPALNKMLTMAEDEDDSTAAKIAAKEMNNEEVQDAKEFNEGLDNDDGNLIQNIEEVEFDDPNDPKYYEGTRHVEDYMLRFIAGGYLQ